MFPHLGPEHSEGLECPSCGSIARERVVYEAILRQFDGSLSAAPIVRNSSLKAYTVLEFSPRSYTTRLPSNRGAFKEYVASDFDESAHRTDVKLDLLDPATYESLLGKFDIIICSHVLEHIPDYHRAIGGLWNLLSPAGKLFFQVPVLEGHYTPITWDEFHGDNTRAYHRFGFDIAEEFLPLFPSIVLYLGLREFKITSREIKPTKYDYLEQENLAIEIVEFGSEVIDAKGLGCPDLCEVFVLSRNEPWPEVSVPVLGLDES
jgi:SAM-dependent methyltransferase